MIERSWSGVGLKSSSSDTEDFPSPCCPHRHPAETELYLSRMSSTPSIITAWSSEFQDLAKNRSSRFSERLELKGNDTTKTSQVTVVDRGTSTSEIVNDPPWLEGKNEPAPVRSSSAKETSSPLSSSSSSSPSSPTHSDSAALGSHLGSKPILPWRMHLDSSGLQPARLHTDIIQREIEHDLKREKEHRELRESCSLSASLDGNLDNVERVDTSQLLSPQSVIVEQGESVFPESPGLPEEQTGKMAANQFYSTITPVSKLGSNA